MAFWLDRFRREDDEDIWEELRQMLLNPPSEEEIALKKQQEQAKIDATLERMFPTEGKITKTSPRNPYEEIDSKEGWSDELKSQKKAEVAKIQKKASDREREIDREHAWEQFKNYGGATLEIASAAIPGYGNAKLATTGAKYLGKKLAPKVGRKLAEQIEKSAAQGAVIGGIEGAVRGSLSDDNVAKTIARDAVLGAASGAGLGAIGGNIQKAVKGKKLKQYGNIDLLDKTSRKQYSKDVRNYYKDYIQETDFNRDGKITFSNRGIQEQLRWYPQGAQELPYLKNDIKKATRLPDLPNKDDAKLFTDHFEVYRGKYGDHLIEANRDGSRRYYMTKSIPDGTSLAASKDSIKDTNNIIQPPQANFNPSQQSIQKPMSYDEWLEELKRKRKKDWW